MSEWPELADWRPQSQRVRGVVDTGDVRSLAGILGLVWEDTEPVPPLWHYIVANPPVHLGSLGEDGHPADSPLVPPIENRRRVFGGATVRIREPLAAGDVVDHDAAVLEVVEKQGRSGALLIVTERHIWSVADRIAVTEDRAAIYRRIEPASAAPAEPPTRRGPGSFDERALFLFSALTRNAHRIHYDRDYAREVEGHRGLVVHGPLLAAAAATRLSLAAGAAGSVLKYSLSSVVNEGVPLEFRTSVSHGTESVEVLSEGRDVLRLVARTSADA